MLESRDIWQGDRFVRKSLWSPWPQMRLVGISFVVLAVGAARTQTPTSTAAMDAAAPAQLSAATRTSIDQAATKVLADTGVPSASLAVVKGAEIAYAQA